MDDIRIERCTEQHIPGLAALYNDPAVCKAVGSYCAELFGADEPLDAPAA